MENNIPETNGGYSSSSNAIVFDSEPEKSPIASSTWKIVAAYLVLNGLVSKVLAVLAHLLFAKTFGIDIPIAFFLIWDFLVIVLALWAGAFFAGRYVSRHFIMSDKKKVINTIFIFYILFSAVAFFRLLQLNSLSLDWKGMLITIVETIFSLGLFYFLSKVYIKDGNIDYQEDKKFSSRFIVGTIIVGIIITIAFFKFNIFENIRLKGTLRNNVYTSYFGDFKLDLPVKSELGGRVDDDVFTVSFTDDFGQLFRVDNVPLEIVSLSEDINEDILRNYFYDSYVKRIKDSSPDSTIIYEEYFSDMNDGSFFVTMDIPHGAALMDMKNNERLNTTRAMGMFSKNGFLYIVSMNAEHLDEDGIPVNGLMKNADSIDNTEELNKRLRVFIDKIYFSKISDTTRDKLLDDLHLE